MGGKSGDAPPPAVDPGAGDQAAMLQMMSSMMQMPSFDAPAMPTVPDAPAVKRAQEVNWTEKHEQLAAKAKADYGNDQARKKGRSSTIHTSPLLDEEEVPKSIATGG